MYRIRGNLFCKILAVLVFTISALAFMASTLAAVWLYDIDAYGGKREEIIGNAFRNVGREYLWDAGSNYLHGDGYVSFEDTDFRFEIYDEAGEFSYLVGLPGKSGVGGGIVAVHPLRYSVAVWSPRLNSKGNSVMGIKALELLTTYTQESIF